MAFKPYATGAQFHAAWTLAETIAVLDDGGALTPEQTFALRVCKKLDETAEGHWHWMSSSTTVSIPVSLRVSHGGVLTGTMMKPRRALLLWCHPELFESRRQVVATCGDMHCLRPSHVGPGRPLNVSARRRADRRLSGSVAATEVALRTRQFLALLPTNDAMAILRAAESLRMVGVDPLAIQPLSAEVSI